MDDPSLAGLEQIVSEYMAGALTLAEASDRIRGLGFGEDFAIGGDGDFEDTPEFQQLWALYEAVVQPRA